MYKEKMVVCLKNNGKILREKDGIVKIPFNSEYSIMIKNLESRKAQVKISIDGTDVLNGQSLLVNPNDTTELEGFLNDCIAKNRFKFIQKSKEISDFRGDRIDDSLIRIEFQYEKMKPVTQEINYKYNYYPVWNQPYYEPYKPTWIGTSTYTTDLTINCNNIKPTDLTIKSFNKNSQNQETFYVSNCSLDSLNTFEDGITVKGNEINQEFTYGSIGELEAQSHTIILKLVGHNDVGKQVDKVVTTKDKYQCSSCGKVSKSDNRFCGRCGTYLE